ncbi:MAG: hypothetical protein SNJ61_06460 [Fimbriimonadaceae bacterium]
MDVLALPGPTPPGDADRKRDRDLGFGGETGRDPALDLRLQSLDVGPIPDRDDRELVAAVPNQQVGVGVGETLKNLGRLLQHPVADNVAEPLVVEAEIVDVEEEEGDFGSLLEFVDTPLAQRIAPRQVGQGVVHAHQLAQKHGGGDDAEEPPVLHDDGEVGHLAEEPLGDFADRGLGSDLNRPLANHGRQNGVLPRAGKVFRGDDADPSPVVDDAQRPQAVAVEEDPGARYEVLGAQPNRHQPQLGDAFQIVSAGTSVGPFWLNFMARETARDSQTGNPRGSRAPFGRRENRTFEPWRGRHRRTSGMVFWLYINTLVHKRTEEMPVFFI